MKLKNIFSAILLIFLLCATTVAADTTGTLLSSPGTYVSNLTFLPVATASHVLLDPYTGTYTSTSALTTTEEPESEPAPIILIEEVEIDDITLSSGTNRVALDRGEEYDVEIEFTPTKDLYNLEIEAFISGYEYNYDDRISDMTEADDYDENVTYKRKLTIKIPKDIEEDTYKLRIIFADRDNELLIKNFNLKLDSVRKALEIKDIMLSQTTVEAGNILTASVRLENIGSNDEEDVRVELTVKELGLSAVGYIDEIDYDDSESTEEFYLRIPNDTKAGFYTLEVRVDYDRDHKTVEDSVLFSVRSDYKESPITKTVILIGSQFETAYDEKPGVYPITLTNYDNYAKVFVLSVDGVEGWADLDISPASTIILQPEETAQFAVVVTPAKGLDAGTRVFTLNIENSNKTIKQIPMTMNVLQKSNNTSLLICGLEIAVVLLALVLISLGVKDIFKKINKPIQNKSGVKQKVDTYY